jgi:hypothetical protein
MTQQRPAAPLGHQAERQRTRSAAETPLTLSSDGVSDGARSSKIASVRVPFCPGPDTCHPLRTPVFTRTSCTTGP